MRQAEDRLKFALGTRVTIKRRGSKGVIEIEYASEDELQRLYELLVRGVSPLAARPVQPASHTRCESSVSD